MDLHYSRPDRGGAAIERPVSAIVTELSLRLPATRGLLDSDLEAAYAGDPAARSVDEVLL